MSRERLTYTRDRRHHGGYEEFEQVQYVELRHDRSEYPLLTDDHIAVTKTSPQ